MSPLQKIQASWNSTDLAASVQELLLIAIVVVVPRSQADHNSVISRIREVQLDSAKYIKKVCTAEIARIARQSGG